MSTAVYLVGGAVRDLLLGRPRADVDVAVEGDVAPLAARLGGSATVHARFGTATVHVDGLEVDLAETRSETYARPGALPDVRPAPIAADLERRDFTINAMALPLAGRARLLDPFGGRADLERGVIRVLHPGSFVDDPTRALRAARYSARFGFGLEERTAALVREADLSTVSAERIDAELARLATEERAVDALRLLTEWGLVAASSEDLELAERVARLLEGPPWAELAGRPEAILAAALGRPPAAGAPDPRIAAHEIAAADVARPSGSLAPTRGRSGAELAVARALGAGWLDRWASEWRHVELEIDGRDLLAAGVAGPAVGRGLDAALRRKLDGELGGRDAELAVALEAARER